MTMVKIRTLSVVAAIISLLGFSLPASAGTGACQLGYACIWEHNDYEGLSYGKRYNGPVVSSINNMASSATANGNLCHRTRYYDYAGGPSGSYFELYSQTMVNSNYRDPNLRNGAGIGAYRDQNWNDRVSYIWFYGGPNCK